MYTTKQVTSFLGVSDSTIRSLWTSEFSEYLSEHATPPKGQERRFTESDLLVFNTIAILRKQAKEYADIHAFLSSGERLEPEPGKRPSMSADDTHQENAENTLAVAAFQAALDAYETRLQRIEDELRESQNARLAAEIRAARAETELETLRAMYQDEKGQGGKKMSFMDWLRSRRS